MGPIGNKHTYKYDDKSNNIEDIRYNQDGSISSKNIFKYDDKGNLIEEVFGVVENIFLAKHIFKFDDFGNIIECIRYRALNKPEEKYEFIYSR